MASSNRVSTSVGVGEGSPNAPCHGFTGGVTPHNGHVVPDPQVVIVYWDSSFGNNPGAMSSLNQLVSDVLIGSFMKGLEQYGIHLGLVVGSIVIDINKYPIPSKIDQGGFQSQLIKWLDDGAVTPKPSADNRNVVYLLVTPTATKVTDINNACGYHGSGQYRTSGPDNLFWAAVFSYPSTATSANLIAYCVSHELAEVFSNPDQQGFFRENVSGQSCEIGDICESVGPSCCTTFPYLGWRVESYWSQSEGQCHAPSGRLWHTIRMADGSWPFAFGDVEAQVAPDVGNVFRAACSADRNGNLHVCAIDAAGVLLHTIRRADGSWPFPFGDVQAQTTPHSGRNVGATPRVACATNEAGDLHVCTIDDHGGLWHTIRTADGFWPFAFGDVQSQTRLVGPNPGIGPTPFVACATNPAGDLHVCAIDLNGGLWHTIRTADGFWPFAFGDVLAVASAAIPGVCTTLAQEHQRLENLFQHVFDPEEKARIAEELATVFAEQEKNNCFPPSRLMNVACATSTDGTLHVCCIDQNARLWYVSRMPDGSWPAPFVDVQARTRLVGPNAGIGTTSFVACATNHLGDLHLCAINGGALGIA